MAEDLTEQDYDDLTEGLKKRNPKKWREAPKLTKQQEIIDLFLVTDDMEYVSKKFKLTLQEVSDLLTKSGVL